MLYSVNATCSVCVYIISTWSFCDVMVLRSMTHFSCENTWYQVVQEIASCALGSFPKYLILVNGFQYCHCLWLHLLFIHLVGLYFVFSLIFILASLDVCISNVHTHMYIVYWYCHMSICVLDFLCAGFRRYSWPFYLYVHIGAPRPVCPSVQVTLLGVFLPKWWTSLDLPSPPTPHRGAALVSRDSMFHRTDSFLWIKHRVWFFMFSLNMICI